jgi:hypothetical protein
MDLAYIVLTMTGSRLGSSCLLAGLLMACGSGSANVGASANVGSDDVNLKTDANVKGDAASRDTASTAAADQAAVERPGAASSVGAETPPAAKEPALPVYDPKLVREALDRTASSPDGRDRLGLRLAIVEQGPEAPWLVAVVNRGSEPLHVLFDLRTLSLEVLPKAPAEDTTKKVKRAAKPPKPILCALPKDIAPTKRDPLFELRLDPGEAVIDAFDPRLYCAPDKGVSPFAPGATVVPRLGFAEKTKTVWKKGKRETKIVEQTAPFVAELAERKPPEPAPAAAAEKSDDETLAFEKHAVKLLVGQSLTLGEEYETKPEPDEHKSLELVLARGSDASTEREATITVSLLNRSPRAQTVYFRRELVSFEMSGPTGLVECDAGPDSRAPERLSFATIAPGARLNATSRLIELCPTGALRVPGLYLVHGRYDNREGGEEFGLSAFRGRVVSERPALVRVRKGWGAMLAQREPLRVRVGGSGSAGDSAP